MLDDSLDDYSDILGRRMDKLLACSRSKPITAVDGRTDGNIVPTIILPDATCIRSSGWSEEAATNASMNLQSLLDRLYMKMPHARPPYDITA